MAKLHLNEYDYDVTGYNKSTMMDNNVIVSTASCTLSTNNNTSLPTLMTTPITTITITNDSDEEIYKLENIEAYITHINEYLSGDQVIVNVDIVF